MRIEWDDTLTDDTKDEVAKIMGRAAESLLQYANNGSGGKVPYRDGPLSQSGYTKVEVDIPKQLVTGIVGYTAPYALRLHENPQFNFRNGRRGKWLQLSLIERDAALKQYISKELERFYRGR